ncbi:unnamed protein product [Schistosoma rodhaini]|uniref:Homeobox domain-containing protein n=1 Tax=Schistosoma rodhaini TaxID=6188 RepID=A0A183RDY5_9TREM|nr:unnamed protein product [Schistosoma rodhaini]
MNSTTDDKTILTEINESPITESNPPTTSSCHNSFINSSSSPSSSCATDLCAWCQKPNLQTYKYSSFYQSVSLNNTKYKIKPVPVCCSQICFDNLRRAYFKNRRHQLNNQLINEIPAMVISGRLPYTSDSDKEKTDGKRQSNLSYHSNTSCSPPVTISNTTTTNNKLSSKKRLHNQYSEQQHHLSQDTFLKSSTNNSQFQQKSLNEKSNYDLFSNFQLYSQLYNYIKKNNIEMSIPLYDYIIQRLDMNHFINNFKNNINIDHIPRTTITDTNTTDSTTTTTTTTTTNNTDHDININPVTIDNLNNELIHSNLEHNQLNYSNIEIMNVINQLLISSIKNDNHIINNEMIHTTTTNNNNDLNCLNQLLIIPIPIPIFKMAPNLLNILHHYGYHSMNSCKYNNNNKQLNNKDAMTQTINLNKINNEYKQTNEFNKTELIHYLNKNNEKALDLSSTNVKKAPYLNKQCFKQLKQQSFNYKFQNKKKLYSNKKLSKQIYFSGIYKLIHPITKHCYTVKIIPIKR